jgi:tetratricopeptide (TPR) repeat protein
VEPRPAPPTAASSSTTEQGACSKNCALARELANEGDQRHKIDIDGAIERYERAIELDPTNDLYLWKLANAAQKKEDFERVRSALMRAVEIAPRVAKYWRLLGEAELTLARDRAGKERAKESLKRCTTEDPTIAQCYVLLGDAERAIDEPGAAIESYTKAIALDPERAGTYLALAEVYVIRGESSRAESVIQEGLRVAVPHPLQIRNLFRLYMLRADLAHGRGDKKVELGALETAALYLGTTNPEDGFALGSAYARLGAAGRDEARKHLTVFWKRVCRSSAAARFEKECSAANALMQKL